MWYIGHLMRILIWIFPRGPLRYIGVHMREHRFQKYLQTSFSFLLENPCKSKDFVPFHVKFDP